MKLGPVILVICLPAAGQSLGQVAHSQPRVDSYGDPLPARALSRLGTSRMRHGIEMCDLVFSPDGKSVVTGALEFSMCAARLWDVGTGNQIRRFEPKHEADLGVTQVGPLAMSPDGKVLVGSAGTIRLWEVATGREIRRLGSNQDLCYGIAISPDGRTVASGNRMNEIRLWDATTGLEIRALRTAQMAHQYFYPVAFSPDGKRVASGGEDRSIHLWSTETGEESGCLVGHHGRISTLAFSPDGRSIASGSDDKTVKLWDVAGSRERTALKGHEKELISVAFTPDGRTVMSADFDSTIRFWDAMGGAELRRLDIKGMKAGKVAFSPDGTIAAFGCNGAIRFLELSSGRDLHPTPGHDREVRFLAYFPDGQRLLSGAGDDQIRVWNLRTGLEQSRFEEHISAGGSLSLFPDGKTVLVGTWDSILRCDLARREERFRIKDRPRGPGHTVFSADGTMIAWGISHVSKPGDFLVHLADGSTGKEIRVLKGHAGPIATLAFSSDGKSIASASTTYKGDNTIRIWDVASGQELGKFEANQKIPDGRLVMGSVWFSADLNLVACAGELAFTLRETTTGREACHIELPGGKFVISAAFSPDARFLATSEANSFFEGMGSPAGAEVGRIRLWETATGKQVATFLGDQGRVEPLAFSPDGKTLASGGADSTVLFWDLTLGLSTRPGSEELARLWKALATPDGEAAYQAVWRLVRAEDAAVEALAERLRPVRADLPRVRQWIADLSSPIVTLQLKARKMLAAGMEQAGTRPEIEKALAENPPTEFRNRLKELLVAPPDFGAARIPENLQMSRALYALERIATPKAKEVLRTLAAGEPSRLSREARQGLERFDRLERGN